MAAAMASIKEFFMAVNGVVKTETQLTELYIAGYVSAFKALIERQSIGKIAHSLL